MKGWKSRRLSHRPWNLGARFSRNADVPSFLSSVEAQIANNDASMTRPSDRPVSNPLFTASSEYDVEYTYADGVVMTCRQKLNTKNPDQGTEFIGDKGEYPGLSLPSGAFPWATRLLKLL